MGIGDVRSRVYKEGPCPTLFIEFTNTDVKATGSISLLNLISDFNGEVVAVKLSIVPSDNDKHENEEVTVVLEVNSDVEKDQRGIKWSDEEIGRAHV
jgi:hypothetical protein